MCPRTSRSRQRSYLFVPTSVWLVCLAVSSSVGADDEGLSLTPEGKGAEEKIIEGIAAIVNDHIILRSEVLARIAPFRAQLAQIADKALRRTRYRDVQKQAVEQMIGDALIEEEARKLGLSVGDAEVEKAAEEVMRRNSLTAEELADALRREGKTLASYKTQILRPQLLRLRVINIQVRSRVSVSEEEVRARYQQNLRSLGVETQVHARHIFFRIAEKAGAREIEARKEKVLSILQRLKDGEAFETLAREHSDDQVTRENGGDLGTFGSGSLPAAIEAAVFGAKKGEVLGPLRSSRGFHIIQVLDRAESSARPYSDVKNQLKNQIYTQKLEQATKAWLKEMRQVSHVQVRL